MSAKVENQSRALERFRVDTSQHRMEVLLDNGIYRHLRFKRPGSYAFSFDVVTWPGYLAISGDMGDSMFSRLCDMFEFFRWKADGDESGQLRINPGYWAEKCVANDGDKRELRADLFEALVKQRFDEFIDEHHDDDDGEPAWAPQLWEELQDEVLHIGGESVAEAIGAMDRFEPSKDEPFARFRFTDAWEYGNQLQDYTFHFYWRLYAIAYAVRAYDGRSVPA